MSTSKKQDKPFVSGEEGGKLRQEKKAGGKAAGNAGNYIDHEQVTIEEPIVQDAVEVEILPEKQLKQEVAKLNLAEAGIEQLKQQYGALVITGPDDKEGYRTVKDAWGVVRSTRTKLEKKGLEIRNLFNFITKGVKKEEDRLVELLTPLEEDLQAKWKAIDDQKEKAKKDKEEEENRQLMARLEELVGMGMKLVDGFYTLGETISMDVATLRSLSVEQYDKLKMTVQVKAKEAADAKRLKDEEDEKERLRLQQEQDKLKQDQDNLKKEREQMLLERREVRVGKLEGLGMTIIKSGDLEKLVYGEVIVAVLPMLEMQPFEFTILVEATTNQIKELKDKAEKEKKAKEQKEVRIKHLLELGMTYAQSADLFEFDNGHKTITHGGASLFELDDYGFQEHAKILADNIREANESKDKHDREVEEEKKALEDKKKFISASMERAGLSFSYTAQTFYWEDKNKSITLSWNELLPLTEPEISDKAGNIATEIEVAKKFTNDQEVTRKKEEKRLADLGLKDGERWTGLFTSIFDVVDAINPGEFKTKKYQDKATILRNRLIETLKELK